MKTLLVCAALACGVTFASEAKTAAKPAAMTTTQAESALSPKVVVLKVQDLQVTEITICGHYGWIGYYSEEQKQERIDYLIDTYC
jgi:hypothetical protein